MNSVPFSAKTIKRFLAKFTFGNKDQCWEWFAGKDTGGYGQLHVAKNKKILATRFSWMLFRGNPGALFVLHTCDNPSCVNPSHLWLGTQIDNMRDRTTKGRAANHKGERNGRAKISAAQAQEMKTLYASKGYTFTQLGRLYGLHPTTVSDIVNGRLWSDV